MQQPDGTKTYYGSSVGQLLGAGQVSSKAAEMGDVAVNPNQIPATVEVVCGNLRGTYDVAKAKVLYLSHLGGIREATPTEFERLGGRQATKKWKQASLLGRTSRRGRLA